MKALLIALAGVLTLTSTPALADRGDRYRGGGDGYRDYYRGGKFRGDVYRGRAFRGGYRGYAGRGYYGRPYYRPGFRGVYGRPFRNRVVVVPGYGYGGPAYGFGGPAFGYGGGYYDGFYGRPVGYYGRGFRGRRGFYRCRTSGRGTVLGAIAGGLIGNVASDRYDRGTGTLIGAGLGAVAGTAIERDGRC